MAARNSLQMASLSSLAALSLLFSLASAGRMDNGECPADVDTLIMSPFRPYFNFPLWGNASTHDRQKCWVAADCLFEAAGESRKQQFAAIALIMGLIPLTLKDVAWPENRIIHVTQRLPWIVEVVVLALGLVPQETQSEADTAEKVREENMLARVVWRHHTSTVTIWMVLSSVMLLASYVAIGFLEVYSKRSALGCPWPVFVVCWYVVALLPAAIHATFARWRRSRWTKKIDKKTAESEAAQPLNPVKAGYRSTEEEIQEKIEERKEKAKERRNKIVSAVQGADEDWPVQLSWGIYYVTGTLIWTSIMAVTVPELVVWVGLGIAVSASSKLLGFFICLLVEKVRANSKR